MKTGRSNLFTAEYNGKIGAAKEKAYGRKDIRQTAEKIKKRGEYHAE